LNENGKWKKIRAICITENNWNKICRRYLPEPETLPESVKEKSILQYPGRVLCVPSVLNTELNETLSTAGTDSTVRGDWDNEELDLVSVKETEAISLANTN
jgi:hypothetical protein